MAEQNRVECVVNSGRLVFGKGSKREDVVKGGKVMLTETEIKTFGNRVSRSHAAEAAPAKEETKAPAKAK